MSRKNLLAAALAAGLLFTVGKGAWALWVEHQVAPGRTAVGGRAFKVETRAVRDLTHVEVTVEEDAGARTFSPFTTAEVTLYGEDGFRAAVPLKETQSDGKRVYWFRGTPKALELARFELREGNYVEFANQRGKYEQIMGGASWVLRVRDFVKPAGAP
jgi:hypothetical protein